QPDGPTSTRSSPSDTSSETPASARIPPKLRPTLLSSSRAMLPPQRFEAATSTPRRNRRCARKYARQQGKSTTAEAAIIHSTAVLYVRLKPASASESVLFSGESRYTSGAQKSFHVARKVKIPTVTSIGRASGSMILHQIPRWLAPSTRAASESS